jgi:hypothetical protein
MGDLRPTVLHVRCRGDGRRKDPNHGKLPQERPWRLAAMRCRACIAATPSGAVPLCYNRRDATRSADPPARHRGDDCMPPGRAEGCSHPVPGAGERGRSGGRENARPHDGARASLASPGDSARVGIRAQLRAARRRRGVVLGRQLAGPARAFYCCASQQASAEWQFLIRAILSSNASTCSFGSWSAVL